MKKLLFLLPVLLVPSAVNAASYDCAYYVVATTCNSSLTYETYGKTDGATGYSESCYNEFAAGGMQVDRIKIITQVVCDSSKGYAKFSDSQSFCIDSASNSPQSITYYHCGCTDTYSWNGTWTSYSTAAQRQSGTLYNCGNSSTAYRYRCKSGYYSAAGKEMATRELDLQCTACPANATCATGSTTFTCNAGYYKDGNACTSCATTCGAGHTTSTAGATSYAECRAPAATTFTDDKGTFSYSTACCCDDTCDSKCDSGKSCTSNSDCDSNLCRDGCCKEIITACSAGSDPCTTVADCPNSRFYTCTDGCCVFSSGQITPIVPTLNCAVGDDNYCRGTLLNDCPADYTCNTTTHCCQKAL